MSRFWNDKFQSNKFRDDLIRAEDNAVTPTAKQFVSDMRKLMNGNRDLEDMGVNLWEPTVKQLNFLDRLARGDSC